ncbi:MAG: PKD domain-containing protein [Anaerolineae bacterium]|nr:PKD domain-containing protein [Anaerolineae bacterium]
MQHNLTDGETKSNWVDAKKDLVNPDALLVIFLLVSLALIFVVATWGMKRETQQWLPVNLMPQNAGNYEVDVAGAFRLRPINPAIIEAVKQDARVAKFSSSNKPGLAKIEASPTPAELPTPDAGLLLTGLIVSAGGPYEGFEGSPVSLMIGDMNYLLNLVPGSISYRWDLDNDGLYDDARGIVVSVIYFDEGIYPVGIQATDWLGRIAADTATVTISNVAPSVELGQDKYVDEGQRVDFRAMASDPGHDILFYEWNFGDGNVSVFDTSNPVHTYYDDGDYAVRLRVKDNDDGVTEDFLVVHVSNVAPTVDAGPDWVVEEGTRVDFRGTATDPAGEFDPLTYAWDLDFNGDTFTPDVSGPTASVYYGDGPATAAVALRVEDGDGGQTLDVVNVTVNNVLPVFTRVSNNGPVGEGSPVNVRAEAVDVASDILTYAFDWNNDGAFDVETGGSAVHTWYNQGDYTVDIRVADDDGGQNFTTTVVSVFNIAPIAVAHGPDGPRLEGTVIDFSAVGSSDPGLYDVLTYTWNFGDGGMANGINVTHRYADNDVYTATLTVTDDSGASDVALLLASILNANPLVEPNPDHIVNEGVQVLFEGRATDPGTADALSFAWDFVYDGVTFDQEVTGRSARTTYLDGPAVYDAAFRVRDDDYPFPTDDGGEIGEIIDTFRVTVRNVPPVAEAGGPYVGLETYPLTFSGLGADVLLDTLTYDWDLNNDGIFEMPGQTVSRIWSTAGVYTVSLRVTDDDGGIGLDLARVTVGNAPPLAEANGPYSTTVNLPVTLSAVGSTDPTGDPLTYRWNFGDGTPIVVTDSITVTHTYADDGLFTAVLQVDDGRGGIGTDTASVTVNNLPPSAVATVDPATGLEGSLFTFDGSGSTDPGLYDILTYRWDFGDGSPLANGVNVTHAFPDNRTYTVTLTVTDDGGLTDTDTLAVATLNANPIAVAGPDRIIDEDTPISFDGSGSGDPGAADTLTFAWDFDYDGATFAEEATGTSVTTTYSDGPATYTVALRVRDDDYPAGGGGEIGEHLDTLTVVVQNVPPVVDALGPYGGIETIPVALSGSASDVALDTLTYDWDINNDGIYDLVGQTVTNTWNAAGVYSVTLRVTDDDGAVGFDTAQVTIDNAPPTADAGGPYVTTVNLPVTLSSAGSTDPTNDPLTYRWDFGDGSPVVITNSVNVTHTYLDDIVYTITLQVDDGRGGTDADTTTVLVDNLPPTATAVVTPNSALEGAVLTFDGSGSTDPGIYDTLSYQWNFDDGSPIVGGITATHLYADDGVYTAVLTVMDDGGAIDTASVVVDILNANPTAVISANTTVFEGDPVILDGSGSGDPGAADMFIYEWDFDYDGVIFDVNDTGQNVTIAYPDGPALFTVALRVRDDDYPSPTGEPGEDIGDWQIMVNNVPPTASAGGPYSTTVGQPVMLTGTGSDVSADPLSFAWDLDNDGIFEMSGQVVTYTNVVTTGSYPIGLQVNDGDGGVATSTTTVQVNSLIVFIGPSLFYGLFLRKKARLPKRNRCWQNRYGLPRSYQECKK